MRLINISVLSYSNISLIVANHFVAIEFLNDGAKFLDLIGRTAEELLATPYNIEIRHYSQIELLKNDEHFILHKLNVVPINKFMENYRSVSLELEANFLISTGSLMLQNKLQQLQALHSKDLHESMEKLLSAEANNYLDYFLKEKRYDDSDDDTEDSEPLQKRPSKKGHSYSSTCRCCECRRHRRLE